MNNPTYLVHHGIKGQKWGVRRFQNEDGSRTEAGKAHRKESVNKTEAFKSTEASVIRNLSTTYSVFDERPIDMQAVKARGGLTDTEATNCVKYGERVYKEAVRKEPKITNDLVSSVKKTNASMYGLEYRLKQPTSISAKIGSDSKNDNVSFKEAAQKITDAVRYTVVSNENSFVKNYQTIKMDLVSKGYIESKCKNYFEMYKRGIVNHKAVQCTYRDKDGYEFEIQFQTPSSQAAKELKVPLYEEARSAGVSKERANELTSEMRNLAEQVKTPVGITSIQSHKRQN